MRLIIYITILFKFNVINVAKAETQNNQNKKEISNDLHSTNNQFTLSNSEEKVNSDEIKNEDRVLFVPTDKWQTVQKCKYD